MKHLFTPLRMGLIVALSAFALAGGWVWSQGRVAPAEAAAQPAMLFQGCTNVALTWPTGTPIDTVANAVSPRDALESIWRQSIVNDQQRFVAWSPLPNAPNDYTATGTQLEAVFICMRAQGTLNRPAP
jgi:hypothetical protein